VVGGGNGKRKLLRFWRVLEKGYKHNNAGPGQLTGPMGSLLPFPDSTHTYHKVIKSRREGKTERGLEIQ